MISFKEYLAEKAKKQKEDDWHSGPEAYSSGYSKLRDMQEYLIEKTMRTQLFVPKRRDPELMRKWAAERRYYDSKREVDAEEAAKLKEEKSPVLSSFREQPPGNNKPDKAFWTSTAIKKSHGEYTSGWYKYVQTNHQGWQTDYGYLFDVKPSARVFDLMHAKQYYEWAMDHDRMSMPHREWNREYTDDDMRARFPWDQLAKHFDGVHHWSSYGRDDFTYGWDVESTAWFDTSQLVYKGAVKLYTGIGDDDE